MRLLVNYHLRSEDSFAEVNNIDDNLVLRKHATSGFLHEQKLVSGVEKSAKSCNVVKIVFGEWIWRVGEASRF